MVVADIMGKTKKSRLTDKKPLKQKFAHSESEDEDLSGKCFMHQSASVAKWVVFTLGLACSTPNVGFFSLWKKLDFIEPSQACGGNEYVHNYYLSSN